MHCTTFQTKLTLTCILRTIAIIAQVVGTCGIVVKYSFRDFDHSGHGFVSKNRFIRALFGLFRKNLDEESAEIIAKRYSDERG